jgi:hypothetical protein
MTTRIATGDALNVLRHLPSESVYACITSPPYWLVRDYEVTGQIGLEPTPQDYVERLCGVFDEVRRVSGMDRDYSHPHRDRRRVLGETSAAVSSSIVFHSFRLPIVGLHLNAQPPWAILYS